MCSEKPHPVPFWSYLAFPSSEIAGIVLFYSFPLARVRYGLHTTLSTCSCSLRPPHHTFHLLVFVTASTPHFPLARVRYGLHTTLSTCSCSLRPPHHTFHLLVFVTASTPHFPLARVRYGLHTTLSTCSCSLRPPHHTFHLLVFVTASTPHFPLARVRYGLHTTLSISLLGLNASFQLELCLPVRLCMMSVHLASFLERPSSLIFDADIILALYVLILAHGTTSTDPLTCSFLIHFDLPSLLLYYSTSPPIIFVSFTYNILSLRPFIVANVSSSYINAGLPYHCFICILPFSFTCFYRPTFHYSCLNVRTSKLKVSPNTCDI